MTKILGVIPARFASTRFPGKPLVEIEGKTMIQRVYEQAQQARSLDKVVVATDDERIFKHVQDFGGEVIMTLPHHQSGTDRCAEVVGKMRGFDTVVNIQGDEPYIQPSQIDRVVRVLKSESFVIATLAKRLQNMEDILNPNVVKVVFDRSHKAIYFSRSPIPYVRGVAEKDWVSEADFYKHIGLYAYKTETLVRISKLPQSKLEKVESLEQLRWLENGFDIGIATTDLETIGIDTPADLEKINEKIKLMS